MGWEGFAGEGRICEELSMVGALVAMDAEQSGGRGGGQLGEVLAQEGRKETGVGRGPAVSEAAGRALRWAMDAGPGLCGAGGRVRVGDPGAREQFVSLQGSGRTFRIPGPPQMSC